MSRTDRKAWRENKRANHRRNEMRRWDRKWAFGSLWVPHGDGEMLSVSGVHKAYFQPGLVTLVDHVTQFTSAMRRQFENGCMPKQMMTGPESGES